MFEFLGKIKNLGRYECRVWEYHCAGHSQLYIRVNKAHQYSNSFMILFSGVEYFEGPMRWKGANFKAATNEECSTLLRCIDPLVPDEIDVPQIKAEDYRLFMQVSDNCVVKIVAKSAIVVDAEGA